MNAPEGPLHRLSTGACETIIDAAPMQHRRSDNGRKFRVPAFRADVYCEYQLSRLVNCFIRESREMRLRADRVPSAGE